MPIIFFFQMLQILKLFLYDLTTKIKNNEIEICMKICTFIEVLSKY